MKIAISITGGLLHNDKKALRRALRTAGGEIAQTAKILIKSSRGGGRRYYLKGGGSYLASAPGQAPVSRSGELAQRWRVVPSRSQDLVRVRAEAPHALLLEAGAEGGGRGVKRRKKGQAPTSGRVMKPRPYLTTALELREASLQARIKQAVADDIQFKRASVKDLRAEVKRAQKNG